VLNYRTLQNIAGYITMSPNALKGRSPASVEKGERRRPAADRGGDFDPAWAGETSSSEARREDVV
jgi:hypothetical protein